MKHFRYILAIALLSSLISSCYYDKEELLYGSGNVPCTDTTGTVSYAQKVVPLFQQYCYSCHNSSFPSGNIVMGTFAADKALAQSAKLMGSINHSSGFSPMPQGTPKLDNCQIAIVKKWMDSGMPNN
jgi:hypothetical protein